jgi:citrate lyase subunit beta/citryl-CoA lyase
MNIFRSALYLPCSNSRAIEKSRTIDTDCIIFDLEDAVGIDEKVPARRALCAGFASGGFGSSTTAVRVNEIGSNDYQLDLETVAQCQPDLVLLPKVSSVEAVETFASDARAAGLNTTLRSWFMIETSAGLMELSSIAKAGIAIDHRLQCLVIGTNDIARETGVSMASDRRYLVPWLMQTVLVARRYELSVLDGVWNQFADIDGFTRETQQAADMGFDGKTLIHPSQVPIANEVFAPSAEQLQRATRIVEAFEREDNRQRNVINLDGEMVERLHLEQAQSLLQIGQRLQQGDA